MAYSGVDFYCLLFCFPLSTQWQYTGCPQSPREWSLASLVNPSTQLGAEWVPLAGGHTSMNLPQKDTEMLLHQPSHHSQGPESLRDPSESQGGNTWGGWSVMSVLPNLLMEAGLILFLTTCHPPSTNTHTHTLVLPFPLPWSQMHALLNDLQKTSSTRSWKFWMKKYSGEKKRNIYESWISWISRAETGRKTKKTGRCFFTCIGTGILSNSWGGRLFCAGDFVRCGMR